MIGLVHEAVQKLGWVGDTAYDHHGHAEPGGIEDEGPVGGVDGMVGFFDFPVGAAELTEDGAELGEIARESIIVGEDAPMLVDV